MERKGSKRVFALALPLATSADLDASFHGYDIKLKVDVDGNDLWFDPDTGTTTSITVDPRHRTEAWRRDTRARAALC